MTVTGMQRTRRRKTPTTVLLLAATALLVAGCKVDQAKEVATYRKVIDLAAPKYEPGQPLSLRDTLLLANQNNETLSIEGEDYLQELINRRRAVAEFLPTVDLVGAYAFRDSTNGNGDNDDGNGDNGNGNNNSNDENFDVSADLNLNLFNGFRDVNRFRRDTFLIEQERNDLLAVQEGLLLDVAQVYYQILRSESLVRVLESSLALQNERLRDARGQLDAGFGQSLAVAQVEAQVAATRTTLINARRDVATARSLLALLTASTVRDAPLLDVYALPRRVGPLADYRAQAALARRELAAAAAAVNAARREVEVAWGQYYPTVSLNLSAFLYRESIPDERDWDGLLVASIPLFAAGRIHADVREAWSFFRQALLVRSQLSRQVEQQVEEAFQQLAASEARVRSLQAQLSAAEQAYRQSETSYRVGRATNLDRVVAQDALLNAQIGLASEEYDRKVLYLTLLRQTGLMRQELEAMPADASVAAADTPVADRPTTVPVDGFDLGPVTRPAPTTLPSQLR